MPDVSVDKLSKMARLRGKPFRVLIVDDERWVREVFRDFCNVSDAFEVELADTGAEAIRKVEANEYDLITLDLIMPEMSGLDVLAVIKERCPRVPVMIITGNATEKLVNKAGMLGACRVMYKPLMLEDFVSELTSALDR